jgi:uncharacterized protein YkwD
MSGGTRALVALAVLVSAFASVQAATARVEAAGAVEARDRLEAGLLSQINAFRRSRGLRPLRTSARLRAAADAHSGAMATQGFFAHASPDGTPFWRRVQRYYPKTRYWSVGENLLWSSPDVDAAGALRTWLNSPPHRRILLTARWREVGLSAVHVDAGPGVFQGRPVTVVTADFGVRR